MIGQLAAIAILFTFLELQELGKQARAYELMGRITGLPREYVVQQGLDHTHIPNDLHRILPSCLLLGYPLFYRSLLLPEHPNLRNWLHDLGFHVTF